MSSGDHGRHRCHERGDPSVHRGLRRGRVGMRHRHQSVDYPCQAMERMASSTGYFFSDYTATGASSSCISASQPVTSLSQIFQVVAGDLTVSKLIPNGTT